MPPQLSSVAAPFAWPWGNVRHAWKARTALQKPRRALRRPPSAQCVLGRIPTIWAGGARASYKVTRTFYERVFQFALGRVYVSPLPLTALYVYCAYGSPRVRQLPGCLHKQAVGP